MPFGSVWGEQGVSWTGRTRRGSEGGVDFERPENPEAWTGTGIGATGTVFDDAEGPGPVRGGNAYVHIRVSHCVWPPKRDGGGQVSKRASLALF